MVSSFENAFGIPPLYTTIVLVAIAAVIVLRKNATVKVLDVVVPVMAVCYFAITIFIILKNIGSIPAVFGRIFEEAFGLRQAVSGGFGAVLMNGIKRGLFSNEAGSGSAPCAAAAAECETPVSAGLTQALGVFVDTIVICSCTAMIMLTAPENIVAGKEGMDLLQSAMRYHLGEFGVIFIAVTLFLFSFSTFLGILFYARSNVAYLFGDKWIFQTLYKILALVMLFIGGIAAYTFVWDLGDVGIGLMTIFNTGILYLLGGLYHTKKVTPATIEFVDIAGLVKGASKGEGLGNQFLANIREVDAIVHVVRCFEDTNIIHVDGSIDPARDIETINLELIFSDIEILDRRISKIAKQARMDKTLAKELELVEAVKKHLEDGKMARTFEVPDDDDAQIWFKGYNLLTAKPTIYAANVAEDDLADDGASNPHVAKVREMAKEEGAEVFVICAQIEQELAELDEDEKKEYLEDLGVKSA